MNILHVTPYYPPAWGYGPVPGRVAALARAQAGAGHHVTVLTTDAIAPHERAHAGDPVVDGVRVVRVRNLSGSIRTWLTCSTPVGMGRAARALFASQALDVVHLHEAIAVEHLHAIRCVPPRVPVVMSLHGTLRSPATLPPAWLVPAWRLAGGHRAIERVDRFVAASADEAMDATRHTRWFPQALRPDAVEVIPDGTDPATPLSRQGRVDARRERSLPADGLIVLMAGTVTAPATRAVLEAFARVAGLTPDAHLVMVGVETSARPDLEAMVDLLQVRNRVRLTGYLAPAHLHRTLGASDVLLVPGAPDRGFERLAADALAAGLAILLDEQVRARLPDTPAIRGVRNDAAAWTTALSSVLLDDTALAGMREAARTAADAMAWPAIARHWEALYLRLRDRPRPEAPA